LQPGSASAVASGTGAAKTAATKAKKRTTWNCILLMEIVGECVSKKKFGVCLRQE
jgi:hypothetical protein